MKSTKKIIPLALQKSKICLISSRTLSRDELNKIGQDDAKKMLVKAHKDHKQKTLESKLGRAGIPKRFLLKNFNNYHIESKDQARQLKVLKAYADRFDSIFQKGTCLMMVGTSGTGKTHLAVSVLNQLAGQDYSVIFTSVAEILRRLRSSYGQKKETESEVYDLFTKPDLIVIDEVGVAIGDAEKRKAMLFDLINTRYNEVKPSILIGNLTAPEMETYLGTRIFDRLMENNGFILPFEGQSYRRINHPSLENN